MRVTYTNTRNPGLFKGIAIGGAVVGVAIMALQFVVSKTDFEFLIIGWFVLYVAVMLAEHKNYKVVVDDEEGIIFDKGNQKYPMKISLITKITYKESKKGRFRSLFIHDSGVKFMEMRVSRATADFIVAQLLRSNPDIQVENANYF